MLPVIIVLILYLHVSFINECLTPVINSIKSILEMLPFIIVLILHRALVSAHVPSRLEPSGLYRSVGKRPVGVSIVPWKCGQLLCGMQRVRILLHHLTPQLLHTKLEQLLTRLKIGRCRSINTLTHATFSLQWQ